LKEVLQQAEAETNKANGEKEMMTVRMKSLKQQLTESEGQLSSLQDEKDSLQHQLSEQVEENYQLKQALASLRLTKATNGKGQGSMFTTV